MFLLFHINLVTEIVFHLKTMTFEMLFINSGTLILNQLAVFQVCVLLSFFLKLGQKRIHEVRTRGGNKKFRALRLDHGNFSWGSESKYNTNKSILIGA